MPAAKKVLANEPGTDVTLVPIVVKAKYAAKAEVLVLLLVMARGK